MLKNNIFKKKDIAKSIEKNSYMIDCVYIDKQPGMKRKGMEKHIISLKPSFDISLYDVSKLPQKSVDISDLAFRVDCPVGTVPIKRIIIDDIKRFKTLKHYFNKFDSKNEDIITPNVYGSSNGHEYAVVQKNILNFGAGSYLNLWKPHVDTTANEMTLSQIWVTSNSPTYPLDSVEAGWQVYPNKYGDNNTHFFIYFTTMGYGSDVDYGRCYNLDCQGFIQTNHNIAIGIGELFNESSYSQTNGQQLGFVVRLQKDSSTGHWWLIYGSTPVGYYPTSLFGSDGIKYFAEYIAFGGEMMNKNPSGNHSGTEMGSGSFASQGYGKAAYQTGVQYVNSSNVWTHLSTPTQVVDNSNCYSLDYTQGSSLWGTYFYYGGPGYSVGCP